MSREIAEGPLPPELAAAALYRSLFDRGPNRLSEANKFVALATLTAGLIEWRKNLLAAQADAAVEWERKYKDAKAELDDVKLRLVILQKEC